MDATMQALSPLLGGYLTNMLGLGPQLGATVGSGLAANALQQNTIDANNQATQALVNSYNNAIGVQNQFANNSLGMQQNMYNQGVARTQPYANIGTSALTTAQGLTPSWLSPYNYQTYNQGPEQQSINALMGSLGPQYIKTYGMSDYLNSPEYQLQLLAQKKFADSLGGKLSATGGYGSGTAANQLQQNALDSALAGYQTGLSDYSSQNINNFNIQNKINAQALGNYNQGLTNQLTQTNNQENILNNQLNTGLNAVGSMNTAGTNLAGQNAVVNLALANATSDLGVQAGKAQSQNILNNQTANNQYAAQLAGLLNANGYTGGAAGTANNAAKSGGGAGGGGMGAASGGGADITGLVGGVLGGIGHLLGAGASAVGKLFSGGSGGSSAPSGLSGAVGGNNTAMPWQTTSPGGYTTSAPTTGIWTYSSPVFTGANGTTAPGSWVNAAQGYSAPTVADKLAAAYSAGASNPWSIPATSSGYSTGTTLPPVSSYSANSPWSIPSTSSYSTGTSTPANTSSTSYSNAWGGTYTPAAASVPTPWGGTYTPPPVTTPSYTPWPTSSPSTYVPYQIPQGPPAGGYNRSNYTSTFLPPWTPSNVVQQITAPSYNAPSYVAPYSSYGGTYTPSYFGGTYTPSYFGGGSYYGGWGYW